VRSRRTLVNQVDVEFLPKGLHDMGQAGMSARLAEVLAAVDETKYEAVLFGLCPVQQRPGGADRSQRPAGHSPRPRLHHALPRQQGAIPHYFHRIPASTSRRPAGWNAAKGSNSNREDSIAHKSGMIPKL